MADWPTFRATAIDVHDSTDGKTVCLTVVNPSEGMTVLLPRQAFEEFRARIEIVFGALTPPHLEV